MLVQIEKDQKVKAILSIRNEIEIYKHEKRTNIIHSLKRGAML